MSFVHSQIQTVGSQ